MAGCNQITVWTAQLDAFPEACWPRLPALLDAGERQRAARFVLERHQRQFVVAHALKRLMLSAVTPGAPGPANWTFEFGAQGKPKVSGAPGLHFNISHCDGLVACAVSHAVEIGIDVECLQRVAPLELAASHFARAEHALLMGMSDQQRPLGFFRLWTLKEVYIKATGLGLAQTLRDFAIAFDPLRVSFADPGLGDATAWQFRQTIVGPETHLVALAWRGAPLTVEIAPAAIEALLAQAAPSAAYWGSLRKTAGGARRPFGPDRGGDTW